jgi:hypothetical protein
MSLCQYTNAVTLGKIHDLQSNLDKCAHGCPSLQQPAYTDTSLGYSGQCMRGLAYTNVDWLKIVSIFGAHKPRIVQTALD